MKIIILPLAILLGALFCVEGAAQSTPDITIGRVLESVEANNAPLRTREKLAEALRLEARTGNSLENPEIGFEYKWGDPSSLGESGEMSVSQGFDFPTTYVYRNRMARELGRQYDHEFVAYRQQLLLETQILCLEIISLRKLQGLLGIARENAAKAAEIMSRREQAGDANILEANKAKYELIAMCNAYKLNEIELMAAENRLVNLNGSEPIVFAESDFPSAPYLRPQSEILYMYENTSAELLALLSEKKASEQDIRLSRSLSLPRFSAGYKYEFSKSEKFNGLTVGMSIPLFGNRNNVKRAKARQEFAESQYQSGLIDIRSDISRMYAESELLSSALEEYRGLTGGAASIDLLNTAMEAGRISLVEYFAELSPIYETYMTLIEVERDYHIVCARINMINL